MSTTSGAVGAGSVDDGGVDGGAAVIHDGDPVVSNAGADRESEQTDGGCGDFREHGGDKAGQIEEYQESSGWDARKLPCSGQEHSCREGFYMSSEL